ncbi:MAG: GspH/FimT family pseudopilin [Hyphomicrobiaceae bacterium]
MEHAGKCIRKQLGTTALELVMGLSVASVLTSAAVPAFDKLMRSRHLVPTTHELVTTLNLARSEALARGTRVAVAARNANWAEGWKVFVDANNNGAHDADEPVIRDFAPAAPGMTITPSFGITYAGTVLSYESIGRLAHPGSHGLVLGRLTLAQGGDVRSLCFASLRVRVVKAATCS